MTEQTLVRHGNTRSYFIRHTNRLAVSSNDINKIWDQDKIAIHFPGEEKEDSVSIKPTDYKKSDRMAIECFAELNENGGCIWAEFYTKDDVKIGKIRPKSFDLFESTWSRSENLDIRRRRKGDKAILKTLQMERVRIIKPYELMSLRVTRPRQGTIRRWKAIGKRLECFVENKPIDKSWDNLSTEQQETVCAEYLRSHDSEESPRLEFLLLPIGRTLKDVDIYGYTTDKREIFAQVTHYNKDEPPCKQKIEKLKRYQKRKAHLVFFCNCDDVIEEDNVLFIPVTEVFEWLQRNKTYLEKLSVT